jgi:GGDEF domain-containing protein
MNTARFDDSIPQFTVVNETPSRESVPTIVRLAITIPNVLWSIGYLRHDESNRWLSVSQSGSVPPSLHSLALPVLRLPGTIDRALQTDSIEHSRLFSIWLREEIGRELTDEDLNGVSSVVAVPLHMGDNGKTLLLIGTTDRSPDLSVFEAFRSDMRATAPASSDQEQKEFDESDGWSTSDTLVSLHKLLLGNNSLFNEFLGIEMMRAVRYHRSMSVLTFTIRHELKRDVPADVMIGVGDLLRRRLRPMDIVGRVRADTLGVVLPETGEGSARWLSPRLRTIVYRYLTLTDKLYDLDIGVASNPRKGDKPESMVDWALRRIVEAPLSVGFQRR